jgi:hypothetical protein
LIEPLILLLGIIIDTVFTIVVCIPFTGKYGKSVNRNNKVGGMAIKKLKVTAAALSVKLFFFNSLIKKLSTSYKVNLPKPGKTIFFIILNEN